MVAIVNGKTKRFAAPREVGEIWVSSASCARSFYGQCYGNNLYGPSFDLKIEGGPSEVRWTRTGELGFIHSAPRGAPGREDDQAGNLLYIMGAIDEVFEVRGYKYFPIDIELTVERTHRLIAKRYAFEHSYSAEHFDYWGFNF
jgi:fatty acid CoA ligase FadD21